MRKLTPEEPRFDFGVGEDASAVTITDTKRQPDIASLQDRVAAAVRGEALLISLPEDGGICGRLVLGELKPEESAAWVARATRFVDLETGRLVIDAGGFLGAKDVPEVTESGDFLLIEVPPGFYQLTAHVYLNSGIATDLFRRRKLSYLDWYRKTNSCQTIPDWLVELAEDRDNEHEEERLEVIKDDDIDAEGDDSFIEVLIQFEQATERGTETDISKSGALKWERRLPDNFPAPLLTSLATGLRGTFAMAKSVVKAFQKEEFAAASQVFNESMRADVSEFLSKQHAVISDKMTIPSKMGRNESLRSKVDWERMYDHPLAVVHLPTLRRQEFIGTQVVTLVDDSHRNQDVYVAFELAFVKTKSGIEAAGISVRWNAPRQRPMRRRRR